MSQTSLGRLTKADIVSWQDMTIGDAGFLAPTVDAEIEKAIRSELAQRPQNAS